MLDERVYKILKYVAQIALPAVGTLYFALAGIWGFYPPHAQPLRLGYARARILSV